MDEDCKDEKPASAFYRHRSPTFSKEEVKALLSIIEKYKTIVFNKSTSSSATFAKEAAWVKITKIFNSQGFSHVRSADCLKMKMDNLKREARKLSKNVMDYKFSDIEVTNQLMAMMCEAENNTSIVDEPAETEDELIDTEEQKVMSNETWNACEVQVFDDSLDNDDSTRLVNRSNNFSPKECNLLLQCVRREKNIILSKACTTNAQEIKTRAWSRVTKSFNKLSPQKRSTKVLKTKFANMKKMAKNINFGGCYKDFKRKHQKLEETTPTKRIKSEPEFNQYHSNQDVDVDSDDGDDHHDVDNHYDIDNETNSIENSTLDPLCTVLNSDFSIGTISQYENKEIVKLKTELLNYKIETAKLQRKRLEDLMQADAADREAKAIETSLRLRTARLEAIAAEMKLPPTHPSLPYTAEEARAQHYIHQYHGN